jgi:hypothetical protein
MRKIRQGSTFAKKFLRVLDVALRAKDAGLLTDPIDPYRFLVWAKDSDLPPPEELLVQVSKRRKPHPNDPIDIPARLSNDEFETGFHGVRFQAPPIDWVYWTRQLSTLTAGQAARLMCGLDPNQFASLEIVKDEESLNWFKRKAKRLIDLAADQGVEAASAVEWTAWAEVHGYCVPDGLNRAVRAIIKAMPTESAIWSIEYNSHQEVSWSEWPHFIKLNTLQGVLLIHGLNPKAYLGKSVPARVMNDIGAQEFFAHVAHWIEVATAEGIKERSAPDWLDWAARNEIVIHSKFHQLAKDARKSIDPVQLIISGQASEIVQPAPLVTPPPAPPPIVGARDKRNPWTDEERKEVVERCGKRETKTSIGRLFGVSRERIRQIEKEEKEKSVPSASDSGLTAALKRNKMVFRSGKKVAK